MTGEAFSAAERCLHQYAPRLKLVSASITWIEVCTAWTAGLARSTPVAREQS